GILARQRKYDQALRVLEMAQQLAPYTHPPKVLLAVFYNQNGDRNKAKALLAEAHAQSPNHPVPELFLAQFAAQEKKWEDGRKYLAGVPSRPIPPHWPESQNTRMTL